MRKEVIFAIIAGAALGLAITLGIYRANKAFSPQNNNPSQQQSSPSSTPKSSFGITIAKPEENDVITTSPTTVTGVTIPNSWIVISTASRDYVVSTNPEGGFEQEIELDAGANELIFTAFDANGASIEKREIVVFSSEFANE